MHVVGYGYHGDFISAWDDGVLERAVSECTDKNGEMKSCGVFEFTQDSASCTLESMPDEIKNENTKGPMSSLPGGCEIQSGPEPAKKGKGGSGSSSGAKSTSNSSKKSQAKDNTPAVIKDSSSSPVAPASAEHAPEQKADGGVFAEKEVKRPEYKAPAPAAPAPSPPTTTAAPVTVPVLDDAGNVIRTDIYTDGRVVHENKVVLMEVTVTEGVKAKRSPEANAEHVKRHGHRHHHMQHGIGGRRMR